MTEAQEKAEEALIKKYEAKKWDAYKKVLTGEFATYDDLVVELMNFDEMFKDELRAMEGFEDYDSWFTLSPDIKSAMDYEKLNVPLAEYAWNRLHNHNLIMSVPFDDLLSRRVFTNEDGEVCDENGVPLSCDLEHRVFEVIHCNQDPD